MCSSAEDNNLIIWDLEKKEIYKKLIGHRHDVSSVCYSPCGKFICSASFDKMIRIWDAYSG